jgi:hypothetical protein
MKATITFSPDEVAHLVRQHLLKVKGVSKVANIAFKTTQFQDDAPEFDKVEVTVELVEG